MSDILYTAEEHVATSDGSLIGRLILVDDDSEVMRGGAAAKAKVNCIWIYSTQSVLCLFTYGTSNLNFIAPITRIMRTTSAAIHTCITNTRC